ncbi:HNH endonuclease [Clostridium sp. DJ247]|uniref:HNH endonuclease n=1 Tax=Clostridium sp. DJ247 TaxID=2726188 RepID=UPI001628CB3D|nr:HNH endonuclease [Clostridium sp. DJ247]MBC2580835.1 HNH endonuclease [Clostridium sp. DJ247]
MKKCIFCRKDKNDEDFNKEHIILDSLGGRGSENIFYNVCIICNGMLGNKVDSLLANKEIMKYMRFLFKIKGRNGVPNPFDSEVKYAETSIVGKLQTNKQGDIIGFRGSHKRIESKNSILICGPKKNFAKYVQSQLKANHYPILSEEEINNNLIDLGNPKIPHIEYIELPEEVDKSYIETTFPAMLKMAYEFSFIKLGEKYLDDPIAIDISNSFMEIIENEDIPFKIPTNACVDYLKQPNNEISLTLYTSNSQIYVEINIYGLFWGNICMSENANNYEEIKKQTLKIKIDSDALDKNILKFSDICGQ